MRILTIQKTLFTLLFFSICSFKLTAQESKINIQQDPKFEQLLNEKRKINPSIAVNEQYKIQIFSGNSEKAKSTLNDCKQSFTNLDGTIVFNTPNYKVWIGNFKAVLKPKEICLKLEKSIKMPF